MTAAALDFGALCAKMKEAGAFSPYPAPLGKCTAREIHLDFRNPAHPGDVAYENGRLLVQKDEINIPQTLIDAQSRSFLDAINLYMPEDKIQQWMEGYFTHLKQSKAFKDLLVSAEFPRQVTGTIIQSLDDKLTMQFDDPERSGRRDRVIYTNREIRIAQDVCRKVPQIVLSVLAYQASYIEYIQTLGDEIEHNQKLTKAERAIGLRVVKNLEKTWKTNNFMTDIVPSIALHYYKNHTPEGIGEPPNQKDFADGVNFIIKQGVFLSEARTPEGEVRKFACPAKGIISRTLKLPLKAQEGSATQQYAMGKALFDSMECASEQLMSGLFVGNSYGRSVRRMIDRAQELGVQQ